MSLTHSYRNLNQSASHYICCAVQDMWVLWWQHTKKCEHPNLNFYGFKSSSGVTASPCNLNHVPYPVWGLTVSFCCLGWRPKCFPALLGPESGIFWSDGLRGSHWWIRPVRRINTCTHIPVTFVSDGYFSALFLLPFCSWRYIANAGDARAVLGVQEEDGSFSVHTLSNDHSAQNDEEVARIRGEHPPSERKTVIRQVLLSLICSVRLFVTAFIKTSFCRLLYQDRLLGLLMPFRAFGDVKFKWSIELQKRVLESGPDQLHENEHTKFIPPNYHTPPYLTAEPEITYHKLRPQDRFMVREEAQHHQIFLRLLDTKWCVTRLWLVWKKRLN